MQKRICVWIGLCLVLFGGTGCIPSSLEFSPDGRQLLLNTPQGNSGLLGLLSLENGQFAPLTRKDPAYGKWSPTGKKIAIIAGDSLSFYNVETGRTKPIAQDVFQPSAWREDGKVFAAVHVVRGQNNEIMRSEIAFFDPDGYMITTAPYGDSPEVFRDIQWNPGTDEVVFLAADQKNSSRTDLYLTESERSKKVTSSGDVTDFTFIKGTKTLLWSRASRNLHYMLLTLYQMDVVDRIVHRLNFPDRIPALNPNPRTAPERVGVTLAPDGRHLVVVAELPITPPLLQRVSVVYSMTVDGGEVNLLYKSKPHSRNNSSLLRCEWSPNSRRVAIQDFYDSPEAKLYIYDLATHTKIAQPLSN